LKEWLLVLKSERFIYAFQKQIKQPFKKLKYARCHNSTFDIKRLKDLSVHPPPPPPPFLHRIMIEKKHQYLSTLPFEKKLLKIITIESIIYRKK